MSFNSSSTKRPRSNSPDVSVPSAHSSRELPPPKRIRQYDAPSAHLTRLSDELFVRIASYLNTRDLASFQRVSRRCQRIAIDSQVWRVLFHRRFSPRSRLQRPSASSTAISSGPQDVGYQYTNWKGLYKLRHNWNAGSCGIREIDITTSELTSHPQTSSLSDDHSVEAQESSSASTSQLAPKPSTLVKLHEGVVYTADAVHGLRAWRARGRGNLGEDDGGDTMGEDDLIARHDIRSGGHRMGPGAQDNGGDFGAPSALAVDEDGDVTGSRKANVTIGFMRGGFAIYQLDMTDPNSPMFRIRYLHRSLPRTSDINGPTEGEEVKTVTAIASLGSFLSVMQQDVWTLYDFSKSSTSFLGTSTSASIGATGETASTNSKRISTPSAARMIPQCLPSTVALRRPQILASLRSSTVWPPISLSLRRSVQRTILASIIYAYPLYVSGWSVGIQELRFTTDEDGEMKMAGSRIATSTEPGFTPISLQSNKGTWVPGLGSWSRSQLNDPPIARPTSLSYSHPYLIASHPDNTLSLHLVRSTDTSLTITAARRLHGHTSAVGSVHVTPRGKAVSVSARGEEVRVWELEGGKGKGERNVKVEKAWYAEPVDGDHGEEIGLATALGGFDEQMVVFVKIMASPSSSPVVVNGRRKMADMSLVETGTMSRNGDSPAAATKHAGNGQPSAPTADFDINGIDDDVDDESFDHQHQCTNTSSSSVGAGNVTNYPVRTSTRTALVVYDFTR